MVFALLPLAVVALAGGAHAWITTVTQWETNCWTATTLAKHATVTTPVTTTTTTLPLTTTTTEKAEVVTDFQTTTYTYPVWWDKKRDGTSETIVVSDVCGNYLTVTVVLTDYVANPTLTATSTVFESTATYLSVYTTV